MKKTSEESLTKKTAAKRQDVDHVLLAFHWLKDSTLGHFVSAFLLLVLIVGIDVLLTGNSLHAFLLLFGIEFLLANIFIWLVVVLRQRAKARREMMQSKEKRD